MQTIFNIHISQLLPAATKLGQGYVFTRVCVSVHGGGLVVVSQHALQVVPSMPCSRSPGGVVSQHALQVVSQHALQQVSWGRVVFQHALQVVSQHALQQVSKPTPSGEVEGSGQGGLQAHNRDRESPGPHLGRGVSRTTPGEGVCIPGCTEAEPPSPPWTATAAGGTHPTGMHSC